MSDLGSDTTQAIVLDMDFIQRNIRDLAKTAQFTQMSSLEELHDLAYKNLKEQLQPGKPLAVDPELALRAYQTLGGMALQFIEAKRRAADTILKARTLFDAPPSRKMLEEDEEGLPEDGLYEASAETGMFGSLVHPPAPSDGHDLGEDHGLSPDADPDVGM